MWIAPRGKDPKTAEPSSIPMESHLISAGWVQNDRNVVTTDQGEGRMVRMPVPKRMWLLTLFSALTLVWSAAATHTVAAQDAGESVTVDLHEVRGSGVSGTAILTAQDGQTKVDMTLGGPGLKGDHPTHIHTGTCSNFDPNPLIPLETVVLKPVDQKGRSVTTIDASLASLQSGDYVILVHLSHDALTTYLACGEIPRVEGAGGMAGTTPIPAAATGGHAAHSASTPMPTPAAMMPPVVGVGSSIQQVDGVGLAIGLAVAAGFLLIGAAAVKRRGWT
jgi:hypothetical protein